MNNGKFALGLTFLVSSKVLSTNVIIQQRTGVDVTYYSPVIDILLAAAVMVCGLVMIGHETYLVVDDWITDNELTNWEELDDA